MFIVQVVMVVAERAGFLYIAYNLSWVVHVFHSIDFILLFYLDKKDFVQIFQGYRKFYRYGTDERIHIHIEIGPCVANVRTNQRPRLSA